MMEYAEGIKMTAQNDLNPRLQTWSTRQSHMSLNLVKAELLTADDYFAAFINPDHDNFETESNRAAVQLMAEVLDQSGSDIASAPRDFIARFLEGHEGVSGNATEVLDWLSALPPLGATENIRLAVRFPTEHGYDEIQNLVKAEQNGGIKYRDVLLSPMLFTRFICQIMQTDFDADMLSNLGVLPLCYGAKVLRTPAWQEEEASGVLLLVLKSSPRHHVELRAGATEPLTVQGAKKIMKLPPPESTGMANDTGFLSEWRLDNYMHHYLLEARDWAKGDRVLDVGCGYSMLPRILAEEHGAEMWAVDDTDLSGWSRQYLDDHQISNKVTYLQELVGDPDTSKLPNNYFDVIYSKVAIHFSPLPQDNVYRHVKTLLRPNAGSEVILLIGTASPFESNPNNTLEKMAEIGVLEDEAQAVLLSGQFNPSFWRGVEAQTMPRLVSPFLYCAYIMNVMDISAIVPSSLRAKEYFSNADTFYDAFYTPALNACYRRDVSQLNIATTHTGAMAVRLKYG